uniref:suppressor protein SRP40 isoform X2 n=1 Tax=Scatophagus argus TaxID=75038 RepID=UPI001ED800DE|nr:suppressor protein SRP40 isoform X2 [Scatophagus argus]
MNPNYSRSEETRITGALSTKDQVTAHQNCLLFSSGIFCRDSPESDDLFGFSVKDVMIEVKRGSKLVCTRCKKKGATAGCEVKRCKRSYHYPCAVQEGAKTIEDEEKGSYGLYCFKHYQQKQENKSSVNGCASSTKPHTSKNPSQAGPSKVYCLTCEKTEGTISLENLSDSIVRLYCDKHAPLSHKRNTRSDSTAARPFVDSSDSSSSSSTKHLSYKRRLSCTDKHQAPPFKRKSEDWNGIVTDDSSDPDANVPDTDIAIFGPIESDLEGSESQLIRRDGASPTGSTSGNQLENDSMKHEIKDEDETDAESESLLSPMMRSPETQSLSTTSAALPTQTVSTALALVKAEEVKKEESSPVHDTAGPSVPCQNSTGPPPSPVHSEPHGITSSAVSPAALETTSSPAAFPSQPEPGIDSTSFWRNCNAAGCTQAIFMDFINEMNSISSRIQSDQASQEDYDLALTVMEASGKLAELVTKQHTELQRKQMELQRAAAAMKKVVLPLRR